MTFSVFILIAIMTVAMLSIFHLIDKYVTNLYVSIGLVILLLTGNIWILHDLGSSIWEILIILGLSLIIGLYPTIISYLKSRNKKKEIISTDNK